MNEERPYHAYLLRLWQATNEEHPNWRFSLGNAHTGERHGFASLEESPAFLQANPCAGIKIVLTG